MNFVYPQLLWLALPLLLLFAVSALHAASKRKKMLSQLLGQSASDPAAVKFSPAKRRIRFALLVIVMLLLVGAAARPYRSFRVIPHQAFGRDILVLFDVSKSMWATDVAPSRLEHAKYLLRELVEKTGTDRFGIIAFAGRAFLACPLTSDKTTLLQYIDELGPASIPVGGTDLERPINIALEAFDAAAGNRAILLITDGDELSGNSAAAIAKLRERRIPLFVIGLGDPRIAAPVPDEGGGFKRTGNGELATSRLNEEKLQEFARETGGMYVRSTVTAPGISQIVSRIDRLGKAEQEAVDRTIPYDDFPFLLAAAALLLVVYLLLGERPFEWRAIMPLAMLLPLLAVGATPAELYNQAREKQLAGDGEAAALYEQAIKEGVGNADVRARSLFNLGIGSHRNVEESLKRALESVKAQQLDPALKVLDEALARIGDTEELYRQSLASSGKAPNNLARLAADRRQVEILKKKIEELKEQQKKAQQQTQQAQQQNQQDQQDQQSKDQQSQDQQSQDQQSKDQQSKDQQSQDQQSKDQQSQDQQSKDQQSQDQQSQDQQSQDQQSKDQQSRDQQSKDQQSQDQQSRDQQNADQAIEQAKREAEQLKKQADELDQKQMSEQAERARQELEKAAQERRNNRSKEAQKHLDEAAKALASAGGESGGDKQQEQQSRDQQKQDGRQDESKSDEQKKSEEQQKADEQKKSEDESAEENAESGKEEGEAKEDKISPETAEQLLQMMQDEEKSLRDRINRYPANGERKVEKDW